MKNLTNILALFGLAALVIIGIGAIKDENGTVRYRQGAVLSFDAQTTLKDEDAAWTVNANTALALLANGGSSSQAWSASAITLSATTNQVAFGGTNTTPASTTIVKWVSVTVAGETNKYRIGLAW